MYLFGLIQSYFERDIRQVSERFDPLTYINATAALSLKRYSFWNDNSYLVLLVSS